MAMTPQLPNRSREDQPAARHPRAMSAIEAKVESVVGINIAALQQELSNESEEEQFSFESLNNPSDLDENTTRVGYLNPTGSGSPQKQLTYQGQGQHFEPMDKSVSQTVKLNPKMELSKPDLLKLLAYMEAELQARDVVVATLKTERIKNLLHYGRVGLNDPFLALQRDNIGGQVVGSTGVNESELRNIEETQLQQLENLINQQRKAHQRMRQILREAEKRHYWTVEELQKECKKHENDPTQEESLSPEAGCTSKTKQSCDAEGERAARRRAEREVRRLHETLEEERGKQKQIILMLVEERKRLALQYTEERKRSQDLAQLLSEEKSRIDAMAEGLEEESQKSLRMEAELEKHLAQFDTEKHHMGAQIARKDDRILDLEALTDKLHREVEHCKKQLQEAHNVAMFQQTLSVSPPRLAAASAQSPSQMTQPRPQPPSLPAKPATLGHTGQRLQSASGAHANVTKALQLTATVNSVPVTGPSIARGVQPVGGRNSDTVVRAPKYAASNNESEDASASASSQVVSVSPRVAVSASAASSKVITTSHGGAKVTFHVTAADATPADKKPAPPTRIAAGTSSNLSKSAPPVPPNKPILPPKKGSESPLSVEVKPQKVGPQTVKFGITISKGGGGGASPSGSIGVEAAPVSSPPSLPSVPPDACQAEADQDVVHECVHSLCHEIQNFHHVLSSMADSPDLVADMRCSSDPPTSPPPPPPVAESPSAPCCDVPPLPSTPPPSAVSPASPSPVLPPAAPSPVANFPFPSPVGN